MPDYKRSAGGKRSSWAKMIQSPQVSLSVGGLEVMGIYANGQPIIHLTLWSPGGTLRSMNVEMIALCRQPDARMPEGPGGSH